MFCGLCCSLFVVGSLVVCCVVRDVGYWLVLVGLFVFARCLLYVMCCFLFALCCRVAVFFLKKMHFVVCSSLLGACCLWFVVRGLMIACCL